MQVKESILHRKYVIPFVLACVILACNQATGINSVIGYNTTIYIQAGLTDVEAHDANPIFSLTNFLATIIGVVLVDRKAANSLLSIGTAGIIASLAAVGFMFQQSETRPRRLQGCLAKAGHRLPNGHAGTGSQAGQRRAAAIRQLQSGRRYCQERICRRKQSHDSSFPLARERSQGRWRQGGQSAVELVLAADKQQPEQTQTVPIDGKLVASAAADGKTLTLVLASTIVDKADGNPFPFVSKVDQHVVIPFTPAAADKLLEQSGEAGKALVGKPVTMGVIYAYGDYRSATPAQCADDKLPPIFDVNRGLACLPARLKDSSRETRLETLPHHRRPR